MKKAEKYINYKNVLEARKLKSSKKQNTQKTETQTKNYKLPQSNEGTTYKVRTKIDDYYTPLNASQGRILNEIMNMESKDIDLDVPKPLRTGNGNRDPPNYCR